MKNCLYITHCYALPDQISSGPAKRHFSHVQGLVDNGYDVKVITSDQSTVIDSILKFDTDKNNPSVTLVSSPKICHYSLLSRVIYHMNFVFKALFTATLPNEIDVVISSVPALPIGWVGYFLSLKYRATFVLDVRDLWTESLATTAFSKIPYFLQLNKLLEKALYNKASRICCTSMAQLNSIKNMVYDGNAVEFVPNGIDSEITNNSEVSPFVRQIKHQFNWVGLYAGKHSKYTDLGNLISAAKRLENDGFALILLGGGYSKKDLQDRVRRERMRNVFFHPPVPKSEVASFEAGADIFFINYSLEQAWAKVLPNKLFDYMYWNKPIVAAVVPGEITKILRESGGGIGVTPGDVESMAKAIRLLLNDCKTKYQSRTYLMKYYDRKNTVNKFINMINLAYNLRHLRL